MSVLIAGSGGMNKFTWKWSKDELRQDKPIKVFSCFSCGGGFELRI